MAHILEYDDVIQIVHDRKFGGCRVNRHAWTTTITRPQYGEPLPGRVLRPMTSPTSTTICRACGKVFER